MRANLELEGGLIMAEAVMMAAAPMVGRGRAHDLVYEACATARREGLVLAEAIRRELDPELVATLPPSRRSSIRRSTLARRTRSSRPRSSAGPARLLPPRRRLKQLNGDPVRISEVQGVAAAVHAGVDLDRRADERVDPSLAKPLIGPG